ADPFPRLQLDAQKEPSFLKRIAKKLANRRKLAFCRNAVALADLVFAHNAAVVERFREVWNDRCFAFDRSFVTEEILLTDEQLAARKQFLRDTSQPLKVLVAGRLIKIKGVNHVIEAIAKLRERNLAVELDVMGEGEDLPAFRQLVSDRGLTDVV